MRLLLVTILALQCFISVGQTQTEMNIEAYKKYKAADKELNTIYKEIIKRNINDTAFIHNLKKSQRLWIQFREAELKMIYPNRADPNSYGSIQPLCESLYLEELTKERIKKLKRWIDGIEEGELCGGTIPIKQ